LLRFETAHPGRCQRIYYEAFVSNPRPVLANLFSFLDLNWDERLIDSIFSSEHDAGVEDFKVRFRKNIHKDSLGSGSTLALNGVPEKTLVAMRRLLEDLGYPPTPQPQGEAQKVSERREGQQMPGTPSIAWLFENHLRNQLRANPRFTELAGSSYLFAISGEGGGNWVVDASDGGVKVLVGAFPADCTINMSAADLADLVGGRLMPLAALRGGRLRIEGAFSGESLLRLLELFSQEENRE